MVWCDARALMFQVAGSSEKCMIGSVDVFSCPKVSKKDVGSGIKPLHVQVKTHFSNVELTEDLVAGPNSRKHPLFVHILRKKSTIEKINIQIHETLRINKTFIMLALI